MKNHLLIAASLATSVSLGCAQKSVTQTSAPKIALAKPTFTSKKHGFALYLPSQPKTFKRPLEKGSSTQVEVYVTIPKPVSYLVIQVDLSPEEANLSQKKYFDASQQGIVEVSGGELTGARDEKINGRDTRIMTYSFLLPSSPEPLFGETHLYKIGKRSFQFTAYVPQDQLDANRAQIDKVFNSVAWIK